MKKAWIQNDVIRDVANGDPYSLYHSDVAKFYDTDVPDNAENGDAFKDGTLTKRPVYVAPVVVPEPPVVVPPKVGPIAFKLLFTAPERITAKQLRATDPGLDDFWGLLDDPRTDVVDLSLASTQGAIEYTLTKVKAAGVTVDIPARKAEILIGVVL
jgi:hypothetical protein